MRVAVIAEKKTEELEKLIKALKERKLEAEFVDVGDIGILVEKNVPMLFHEQRPFSEYDAVFLTLPLGFTLFAEPFLAELVDNGIYCPLKPNSFYLLSNKPYLYSALNAKKVPIPKTDIIADKETIDYSIKEFSYPVILKTFLGLKKTNSVLIESERSLKSFVKSISVDFDAITIQEYLDGDVDQCLVIGDNVYSVRRKWSEKELGHSKKAMSQALSDKEKEIAIRAAKVIGMDIGVVKMIQGKVIGVRNRINFKMFEDVLSQDMFEKIAIHYNDRLKGDSN